MFGDRPPMLLVSPADAFAEGLFGFGPDLIARVVPR
jgi:hypothetical protein